MVFPDLLFAFVIGLVFTGIFAIGLGRRGPWASIPVFFLPVILAAWVGGAWAAPIGPLLWGRYWLPFALMGLLIALLLVAAAPAPQSTVEVKAPAADRREERHAEVAFEIFFWILLITMIFAIVVAISCDIFFKVRTKQSRFAMERIKIWTGTISGPLKISPECINSVGKLTM